MSAATFYSWDWLLWCFLSLAIDLRLSWIDGCLLLLLLIFAVKAILSTKETDKEEGTLLKTRTLVISLVLGILGLSFGAPLTIEGVKGLATHLEVPPQLVGLTLLAVGTSLPETSRCYTGSDKERISVSHREYSRFADFQLTFCCSSRMYFSSYNYYSYRLAEGRGISSLYHLIALYFSASLGVVKEP